MFHPLNPLALDPHLLLGIDASKGYADLATLNDKRKPIGKPIKLDDTSTGHAKSLEWIVKKANLVRTNPTDPIVVLCAAESTGGYERNWLAALSSAAPQMLADHNITVRVARLNPRLVNASRKAENQRNYSDETSAYAIATFLGAYPNQVHYKECFAPQGAERCRPILNEIKGLTKAQTAERNRLQADIQVVFPHLIAHTRGKLGKQAWQLLSIYPTAKSLSEARGKLKKDAGPLAPIIRKMLSKVHDKTEASFIFDNEQVRNSIKRTAKRILTHEQEIKEVKMCLVEQMDDARVEQLCTIPGIAEYSACTLLIEIGDITRFENASKLAAYFGVHPSIRESGDFKGKSKLSKNGSATARNILYLCARVGMHHCPHLRHLAAEKYGQNRKYDDVVCIVAHKILRMIYGMLTNGTTYDPKIDVANGARKASTGKPDEKAQGIDENLQQTDVELNAPNAQTQTDSTASKTNSDVATKEQNSLNSKQAESDYAPLSSYERRKRKAVMT